MNNHSVAARDAEPASLADRVLDELPICFRIQLGRGDTMKLGYTEFSFGYASPFGPAILGTHGQERHFAPQESRAD